MNDTPTPRYRRRVDAAKYVREAWGQPCSPAWLAKLAVVGGGPIFSRPAEPRSTTPMIWTHGPKRVCHRRAARLQMFQMPFRGRMYRIGLHRCIERRRIEQYRKHRRLQIPKRQRPKYRHHPTCRGKTART